MKTGTVQLQDIKISYLLKPVLKPAFTVIFIHGFPFNKSTWKEQLDALPEQVQGLAYDVRGHGKTGSGRNWVTIDLFAKDLIALIDALKLTNVVLCGVSMGGYISLRAMELSMKNISGLILSDTNAVADSNEAKLNRFAAIDDLLKNGSDGYAEATIKKLFVPETFKTNPDAVSLIRKSILDNSVNSICATLLALASRTDTTAMLDKIDVPTLIIRGAHDVLTTHPQAVQLHQGIKNSAFITAPCCGHLPNLEDPELFNGLLHNFLSMLINK